MINCLIFYRVFRYLSYRKSVRKTILSKITIVILSPKLRARMTRTCPESQVGPLLSSNVSGPLRETCFQPEAACPPSFPQACDGSAERLD